MDDKQLAQIDSVSLVLAWAVIKIAVAAATVGGAVFVWRLALHWTFINSCPSTLLYSFPT